jgi:hypothetical protein
MKMNTKKNAKTLLIIIILVFAIIPFLFVLLNEMFGIDIREGFKVTLKTNGENGNKINLGLTSDLATNTQIDRVKTEDGKYKYCIGTPKCSSGSLIKNSPNPYTFNDKKIGYTYQNKCGSAADDSTLVTCDGPSSFSKFYGPFDNVPFEINENSLTISDEIKNADPATAATQTAGAATAATQTAGSTMSNVKCLADNGASVGDPLCCGQDGVVQNTKYNCPSEYPHCIGYKCGETWGKCSTTVATKKK